MAVLSAYFLLEKIKSCGLMNKVGLKLALCGNSTASDLSPDTPSYPDPLVTEWNDTIAGRSCDTDWVRYDELLRVEHGLRPQVCVGRRLALGDS